MSQTRSIIFWENGLKQLCRIQQASLKISQSGQVELGDIDKKLFEVARWFGISG